MEVAWRLPAVDAEVKATLCRCVYCDDQRASRSRLALCLKQRVREREIKKYDSLPSAAEFKEDLYIHLYSSNVSMACT